MSSTTLSEERKSRNSFNESDIFFASTPLPEESDLLTSGPINEDVVNGMEEAEEGKGPKSNVRCSFFCLLLFDWMMFVCMHVLTG